MPTAIVAAEEKEYIERDEDSKERKKIHKYVSIITVASADNSAVICVEDPDRTVLERIERYMASNQR